MSSLNYRFSFLPPLSMESTFEGKNLLICGILSFKSTPFHYEVSSSTEAESLCLQKKKNSRKLWW